MKLPKSTRPDYFALQREEISLRSIFLIRLVPVIAAMWLSMCSCPFAREVFFPDDVKEPDTEILDDIMERTRAQHSESQVKLCVTNWGFWGFGIDYWPDYLTGEITNRGSEYPRDSYINQLQSAQIWMGGVRGHDTLVTTAVSFDVRLEWEWWPDRTQTGWIDTRSTIKPDAWGYDDAVSHQDLIVEYIDTIIDEGVLDFLRGTLHQPLRVAVTQKTYSWSIDMAEDFILFDVNVENYSQDTIKDVYLAIQSTPSVGLLVGDNHPWAYNNDCFCGFLSEVPSAYGCGLIDTLNMMWGANNDGDPVDGEFTDEIVFDPDTPQDWVKSATSVHGHFFLDYPGGTALEQVNLSYNWWSPYTEAPYNFGPRHRDDTRNFMTNGTGWPSGDANKYHVMRNDEIDYDMARISTISFLDPVWQPPPGEIAELASTNGLPSPPNLLSIGPWDLPPGFSIPIAYAFVCGENFHTDPNNIANLPHSVDRYYANLDFSDLILNASWAKRVYDNPGFDTDGNDYRGEFVVCDGDTVWYTGDGVPDWRITQPPASPQLWLQPIANGLRVRFNGTRSETEKDPFTGILDFEGYHVYCGIDERKTSLALTASYDRANYDKYVWNGNPEFPAYRIKDIPFTLDSLRCLYGLGADPCSDNLFDPLFYTVSSPYVHADFPEDSIFYFSQHDFNASEFGITTPITKIYPDEPDPAMYHPDSIPDEAYTVDGYLKYYEYQSEIHNLMPTIPYWVSATAFDFGQPDAGVKGLESSLRSSLKSAFPAGASDVTTGQDAKVYVYPNPYHIDAEYRDHGFEGRLEDDRPDYRVRAINFANLPPKCNIYIYSLDGDLVRELKHDMDPSDPNSSHDTWNLITRNTQMVVTGLYYWVIEAEDGSTQMGKLVIIF